VPTATPENLGHLCSPAARIGGQISPAEHEPRPTGQLSGAVATAVTEGHVGDEVSPAVEPDRECRAMSVVDDVLVEGDSVDDVGRLPGARGQAVNLLLDLDGVQLLQYGLNAVPHQLHGAGKRAPVSPRRAFLKAPLDVERPHPSSGDQLGERHPGPPGIRLLHRDIDGRVRSAVRGGSAATTMCS
jgi:hypothetical protein